MESISVVTVTEKELDDHLQAATAKVYSFPFKAPVVPGEKESPTASLGGRRISYRPLQNLDGAVGTSNPSKFSLVDTIQAIYTKDDLFTDTEHHVLRMIRRSIQVFLQIYRNYEQASGLERLKAANKEGPIGKEQEAELKQKAETASAVSLFCMASYLLHKLHAHRPDEVEALTFEVSDPELLSLETQNSALHGTLHYLLESIKDHARDDVSLARSVLLSARALAERIQGLQASLSHLDFYLRYHYRLETDDLTLSGLQLTEPSASQAIDMVEKRPEEVVGNHIAKFESMRLAQRLVCYDMARQKNPLVELGGFSFTIIGDGSPGTGKTTLIQMTVSLLRTYCRQLDLPFRYLNFSIDEISDYQGRSGQNAKRFCKTVMDAKSISFGTIDDVDQVCGNRNDKNASAGQLEVTAVFMQEFAGPGTVVRGNAAFALFSNYPEKVDDALRQRTQARFLVDGPKTKDDFTDLLYMMLGKNCPMDLGKGYQPYSTQQVRQAIRAKYEENSVPHGPELKALFDKHALGGKIRTWKEFGDYLHALQGHDERFTGRAVKNICDAVRFRMMDFDIPAEWFENPEQFFRKPYEAKMAMLQELRGTVTPEMMIQEINRYMDSEERYARVAKDRELDDRTRSYVVDHRARLAAGREIGS